MSNTEQICPASALPHPDFSQGISPALTHLVLFEALDYQPSTGTFTWLRCDSRPELIGSPAGTSRFTSRGKPDAIWIGIEGGSYAAHRLAWFYMTGRWPADLIDHRDGDPFNNRWLNLREADQSLNQQNQRHANSRNLWTSLLGVSFHRASGKFEANITTTIAGKKKKNYLGLFLTDVEAHAAYVSAKRRLHAGNTL